MFLSRLYIALGEDPDSPNPGRMWLRNRYRVHQRLCMAFPSAARRSDDPDFLKPYEPQDFALRQVHVERETNTGFLFRIDPHTGGRVVILVQSAIEPDWEYAFHNAPFLLAAKPEFKESDPSFSNNQKLRFRLVANPTRKIDTKSGPDGTRRHGRRVPVRDEQLYDWLARRAEGGGFTIDENSLIVQPGYVNVNKKASGQGNRLRSCRYDGILAVTDPDILHKTLVRGVGPAKAFGFGLLSVAECRE